MYKFTAFLYITNYKGIGEMRTEDEINRALEQMDAAIHDVEELMEVLSEWLKDSVFEDIENLVRLYQAQLKPNIKALIAENKGLRGLDRY